MRELQLESGEALIVVAHPDDETIWMGGTIIANSHIDWTIVVLCRASDKDRAPRFRKAARALGAKLAIINNLEDDDLLNIRESVPEIKKILHNCLKNKRYKYIFTHGAKGEYGHPRHKAVHRAVKQMVLNKKLAAEKVFFFKYKAKGEFMGKMFRKNFKKKLGIISGIYNFNNGSDEYRFASYLPEKVSLLK